MKKLFRVGDHLSCNSEAAHPFFTIGHSTRPLDVFAGLLNEAGARRIVDVRTVPRSRTNPQYNADVLPAALAEFQIGYEHVAALGGLRPLQRGVPPATNAFWENRSFHNYADYAMGEEFRGGFDRLRELGEREACAVMCAETLWWRCHRRIIADYLIAAGQAVFHILGPGQIVPARMTEAARPGADSEASAVDPGFRSAQPGLRRFTRTRQTLERIDHAGVHRREVALVGGLGGPRGFFGSK